MKKAQGPGGTTSARQDSQRALVDDALKVPGVADAIAAYKRVTELQIVSLVPAEPEVTYATGGNHS